MDKELEQILANNKEYQQFKDPKQKTRKLVAYFIRTILVVTMFYVFWKLPWVKYLLFIYVPFNIMGLLLILFSDKLIERRIKKQLDNNIKDL